MIDRSIQTTNTNFKNVIYKMFYNFFGNLLLCVKHYAHTQVSAKCSNVYIFLYEVPRSLYEYTMTPKCLYDVLSVYMMVSQMKTQSDMNTASPIDIYIKHLFAGRCLEEVIPLSLICLVPQHLMVV